MSLGTILVNDLEAVWAKIKPILESIGTEIWSILQRVFTAEESVIMSQLYTMLRNDAVQLQNTQPGISSPSAEAVLKANAITALAYLAVELPYTAIVTVVGAVMHDLQMPDTTGNAGVIS